MPLVAGAKTRIHYVIALLSFVRAKKVMQSSGSCDDPKIVLMERAFSHGSVCKRGTNRLVDTGS